MTYKNPAGVFFFFVSGYLTRFIANTVKKSRSGTNKFQAGESDNALCVPAANEAVLWKHSRSLAWLSPARFTYETDIKLQLMLH